MSIQIPDYQSIMLPLLKLLGDNKEHSLRESIEHICKVLDLGESEKRKLLSSGQPVIDNRVGWARTYMKKAGLLEYTRRAHFRITDRGLHVLKNPPSKITLKYLLQFPEFVEFRTSKKVKKKPFTQKTISDSLDPMELLESAHERIRSELSDELLGEVKKSSPRFFENLVIELIVKMGYGGSREDAAESIGRSGDEGIDGKIKEDRLGLDAIYLQAKKWESTVGRPEIHKFVGALKGQGASKGIFITTSTFSNAAIDFASKIDSPKIVLIDGRRLAELMIEYNVGVSNVVSYEVKKIDSDYFS